MEHINFINIKKNIEEMSAHDEDFFILFHSMLQKFVEEYDDMSQMEAIRLAQELLDNFNS